MTTRSSHDENLRQLIAAIQRGDLPRVQAIVQQQSGTGVFPPRLSLLQSVDEMGRRAEDVASSLADSSDVHRQIVDYLSRERLRMEYFE